MFYCWGSNAYAQLNMPQQLQLEFQKVRSVAAGFGHTCVVNLDGKVVCWGWDEWQQVHGRLIGAYNHYHKVQAGAGHTCVLQHKHYSTHNHFDSAAGAGAAGYDRSMQKLSIKDRVAREKEVENPTFSVQCWGCNSMGQTSVPAQLDQVALGVCELSIGFAHNCAIQEYKVVCWGSDVRQQVSGWTQFNLTSTAILAVGTGDRNSCAMGLHMHTGHRVFHCWGYNADQQCQVPNEVSTKDFNQGVHGHNRVYAVQFALGGSHTCILDYEQSVHCFGWNWQGQTDTFATPKNVQVHKETRVGDKDKNARAVEVGTGEKHTIVIQDNHKLQCQGSNKWNQCNVNEDINQIIYQNNHYNGFNSFNVRETKSRQAKKMLKKDQVEKYS